MPNIGYYHPQIVHFVIALGIVGVVLRLVSLSGKLKWTGPAAATLLLIAAAASYAAARSGHDAHGPVERVPGAAEAVEDHEEWGDRTRNILLVIAGLELIGLALRKKEKAAYAMHVLSALVGLGAVYSIYETGEHGGVLVYDHAGGVGIRSGEPGDITNLLVAGLYERAMQARSQGDKDTAARLFDELARQRPDDPSVKLLALDSQFEDRGDAAGALAGLHQFTPPEGNRRVGFQYQILLARAYAGAGFRDSATTIVNKLKEMAPQSQMIQDLEKSLGPAQ